MARTMGQQPISGPSNGHRVLVVDDEAPLATLVARYLSHAGYDVCVVGDGTAAVQAARAVDPDVVILDLGLPGLGGLAVCQVLRTFSDCYVLMLTARSDEADKLAGLATGADDYMTKPFSPRELVARVEVLLRRPRRAVVGSPAAADHRPGREFGPLRIDVAAREVALDDAPVPLTRTEFDLLAALAAHPERVLTRGDLMTAVWGERWFGDEHLVDVHIGHLRRKLGDDAASPRFVATVRGVGYRMGAGR